MFSRQMGYVKLQISPHCHRGDEEERKRNAYEKRWCPNILVCVTAFFLSVIYWHSSATVAARVPIRILRIVALDRFRGKRNSSVGGNDKVMCSLLTRTLLTGPGGYS